MQVFRQRLSSNLFINTPMVTTEINPCRNPNQCRLFTTYDKKARHEKKIYDAQPSLLKCKRGVLFNDVTNRVRTVFIIQKFDIDSNITRYDLMRVEKTDRLQIAQSGYRYWKFSGLYVNERSRGFRREKLLSWVADFDLPPPISKVEI